MRNHNPTPRIIPTVWIVKNGRFSRVIDDLRSWFLCRKTRDLGPSQLLWTATKIVGVYNSFTLNGNP
jgi:hypothetical protein